MTSQYLSQTGRHTDRWQTHRQNDWQITNRNLHTISIKYTLYVGYEDGIGVIGVNISSCNEFISIKIAFINLPDISSNSIYPRFSCNILHLFLTFQLSDPETRATDGKYIISFSSLVTLGDFMSRLFYAESTNTAMTMLMLTGYLVPYWLKASHVQLDECLGNCSSIYAFTAITHDRVIFADELNAGMVVRRMTGEAGSNTQQPDWMCLVGKYHSVM